MKTLPKYSKHQTWYRNKQLVEDPINFLVETETEFSDLFRIKFFHKDIIVTTRPECVKHILVTNNKNYKKSPAYRQLKLALGNGLISSEGDFWRKQRRLAQPAFHKEKLLHLFNTMVDESEQFISTMRTHKEGSSSVDIVKPFMSVTANIALKTLMSTVNESNQTFLYNTILKSQEYVLYRTIHPHKIPLTYLNGQHTAFNKNIKSFNDLIFELIETRRAEKNRPHDLLTMLLEATDEETGEQMNDQQLRDELITMFTAGHETSANALSWTLYLLTLNPTIFEKLKNEVVTVLGDRRPTFMDLHKLVYLKQVLNEGMRLYPPAWVVGREAIGADEFDGFEFKKGAIFLLGIYAMQRSSKYFSDPNEFNPDRFAPGYEKSFTKMTYLPFGAGPRMCIGSQFALMEMQIILADMVRNFNFELDKNQRVAMSPLITLKPTNGIKMFIR